MQLTARILLVTLLLAPFALHAQDFTLGEARTIPEPKPKRWPLALFDVSAR